MRGGKCGEIERWRRFAINPISKRASPPSKYNSFRGLRAETIFFALLSPSPLPFWQKPNCQNGTEGAAGRGQKRFLHLASHNPCFRDKRIGGYRNHRQVWRKLLQNKANKHSVSSLLTALLLPVFCPQHKGHIKSPGRDLTR